MKQGWEVKRLGEVCEQITDGSHFSPKSSSDDKYPYITVRDIENDQIDFTNCKFIGENEYQSLLKNGCKPNFGDILFSKDGTVGKVSLVNFERDFVVLSSLAIIRPKKDNIFSPLLKYILKDPAFLEKAIGMKTGVAIKRIILKNLKLIEISYPKSLPEQQRIVAILDEAFAAIAKAKANAEQNLKNARELFESYLQSVFENKGEGWEERRFDAICVLQRGFDLPVHSRNEGKHPLVSSNGITDRIDLWKVKAPGVVTGRSGTIGNVHFIEEDFWPLNTALYIKEFHGNFERFIYYFLKQLDLSKYSSGAGVPTLNRNNVHSEIVWFPKSINEQQTIVQKLDVLSAETKKLEAIYQQKINAIIPLTYVYL